MKLEVFQLMGYVRGIPLSFKPTTLVPQTSLIQFYESLSQISLSGVTFKITNGYFKQPPFPDNRPSGLQQVHRTGPGALLSHTKP